MGIVLSFTGVLQAFWEVGVSRFLNARLMDWLTENFEFVGACKNWGAKTAHQVMSWQVNRRPEKMKFSNLSLNIEREMFNIQG